MAAGPSTIDQLRQRSAELGAGIDILLDPDACEMLDACADRSDPMLCYGLELLADMAFAEETVRLRGWEITDGPADVTDGKQAGR